MVPASERALVTGRMTLPNQDIPIVLIEMAGIGYQTKGNEGSYHNDLEALAVRQSLEKLDNCGISPDRVTVLSYYKDQVKLLL